MENGSPAGPRVPGPIQALQNWLNPSPPMIMGDLCPTNVQPPPPANGEHPADLPQG